MSEISSSGSRLIQDFATDTELKAQPGDITNDFELEKEAPAINAKNDFDEKPVNTEESERISTSNLLSVETSASLYVGVFDSLQQMLLRTIHQWKLKRKIGNAQDLERFEELNQSVNDGFKSFDDLDIPERAKVRILKRVQERVEGLPFTDDEYEQLEESLILILNEMPGYQLPPNYALMMAMANVMLPRILDAVVD